MENKQKFTLKKIEIKAELIAEVGTTRRAESLELFTLLLY